MSKSKGNVVVPDVYIQKFGADAIRLYLMFLGSFEQGGDWRDAGIMGPVRFLDRVWTLAGKVQMANSKGPKAVSPWMHVHIKEVTEDIAELKYNTAISELMVVLNKLEEALRQAQGKKINRKDLETFLLLLAPFAPFIAEELWKKTGGKYSIHLHLWPKYDAKHLIRDTFTLIVQINGKLRAQIAANRGIAQKEAEKLALADPRVQKFISDKRIRKIIFVKNRLVNLVI